MLRYMLDTDMCSYVIRERPAALRERFNAEAEAMCISAITLGELLYGAESKPSVRRIVEQFLARITMLDFGYAAAAHYAQIRAELKKQPIGANDTLEHVPEKWTRFSDKDMLPEFLNWREFFPIR
jgi:tRNA(fMet)-specific endonuclease VapC